ncbi:spore protein YabP [Paenibacillus montaniterrae]|uniref:Spore protein YabP n=1 Tax=Paenibacillus montaniterrae TaxID=429341 RepID=A0A920D0I6_9BACL|nr:sporulation protein YabP [Paenibacillus montaniterrae]GIP19610.1 spore protein YabP [Paenibacillus montaniterrae]
MSELQKKQKQQDVKLTNRKLLELTGVTKVESFDNQLFLLNTELGMLTVTGHNLHMKHLSLEQGLVAIEGSIQSLAYSDGASANKGKGLLGKLFR